MSTNNCFPRLDLRTLEIRDQLELVSDQCLFGFAIRHALVEQKPTLSIIQMIMNRYYQAPDMVLDVVSQETINLIKEVYGDTPIRKTF